MLLHRVLPNAQNGIFNRIRVKSNKYFYSKYFSSVSGRATPLGTKKFVERSELPFYHCFGISQLNINPIIHGAPRVDELMNSTDDDFDNLTILALFKNKSNCIVAYDNSSIYSTPWYCRNLSSLLNNTNEISREEVVIMVNIGRPTSEEKVLQV